MKIINKQMSQIINALGYQKFSLNKEYIFTPFCIKEIINDQLLLFNVLTYEMILTTEEELKSSSEYLVKNWWMLDSQFDWYSFIKGFKQTYKNTKVQTEINRLSHITIFTTLDCNARCPYCYEDKTSKQIMTIETAKDIIKYIDRYGEKYVNILWFGGEPLVNAQVIDIITDGLKDVKNLNFNSLLYTNGYLLNEHSIDKLKNQWKLDRVQIAVDGTGEDYYKVKRYINNDVNAFERVASNIKRLIDNEIYTIIRLNFNDKNLKQINDVIDYFSMYSGSRFLTMYSHPLYDYRNNVDNYIALEEKLVKNKLEKPYNLNAFMNMQCCMADSFRGISISPKGNLTICEHYYDDEVIGTIYDTKLNYNIINQWQEYCEREECKRCPLFPQCMKLKKCPAIIECDDDQIKFELYKIKQGMLEVYKNAKS